VRLLSHSDTITPLAAVLDGLEALTRSFSWENGYCRASLQANFKLQQISLHLRILNFISCSCVLGFFSDFRRFSLLSADPI